MTRLALGALIVLAALSTLAAAHDVDQFRLHSDTITGNLDIDVDTKGSATGCTVAGSVVGADGVALNDCGSTAPDEHSSDWGEMVWGQDDWG